MARRLGDDSGSAALEFIGVGVLLLVPLLYLILALGMVQQHTLGAEAAARHAVRAMTQAPNAAAAQSRAEAVLASVVSEYGLAENEVRVQVSCSPAGARCPRPDAAVTVHVSTRVALPFIPEAFGLDQYAAIPIEAQSTQRVARQWGPE